MDSWKKPDAARATKMPAKLVLLLGTALAAGSMIAGPAMAQATPAQAAPVADTPGGGAKADKTDASQTDQGMIVVTGSRAAISGFSAPTPTVVIGQATINQQAAATIAQVLYQEPAFKATRSPAANAVNVANPGQAAADLRGLGPQRTLVLINGARAVPEAPAINSSNPVTTDLNLIPTMMIDRVEVVTGGASAQYGSDAVAGVVNVILKHQFKGLEVTGQSGASQYGDDFNYRIGVLGGFDFGGGRGHAVASVEYNDNKGVGDIYTRSWGRDEYQIVSNAGYATNGMPANILAPHVHNYLSAGGLILGPANFSLRGDTFNADGSVRPYDGGSFNNGTFQIGGEGGTTFVGIDQIPPVRRLTAYGRAEYEVSDALKLIVEGGDSQSWAILHGGIARYTTATIQRDNAFLPAAVFNAMVAQGLNSITMSKTFFDLGNAVFRVKNDTPHGLIGAEGKLGGTWQYDAHYSYGENHFRNTVSNNLLAANLNYAIDAVVNPANGQIVCRATLPGPAFNAAAAGCVPLSSFGPTSATPAAQAYVNGTGYGTSLYKQSAGALNLRGQPFSTWAGPVSIAFGGEYRKETQVVGADALSANAKFSFAGNVGVFRGSFDVKEGYLETIVPLARDMAFAHSFDINAAVRYADYSSVGGQTNWKIGSVYEPVEGLRFRITRSRDIRAPAIFELDSPGSITANITTVNGITARIPVNAVIGNPNLKAERGDTLTAGVVIEPKVAGRLRASLDYYDIDLKGAITSFSSTTIGTLCTLGQAQFCNYITFDAAHNPTSILAPIQNIGAFHTRGLDGVLSYNLPLAKAGTSLTATFSGSYVFNALVNSGAPGSASIDRAGENGSANQGALPRFRANGSLTYSRPEFSITAQGIFISRGTIDNSYNTAPALTINDNNVPAIGYMNLYSTINITERLHLTFSINNVFNQNPPVVPNVVFSTPTNGAYYDKIGRAFQAGFDVKF